MTNKLEEIIKQFVEDNQISCEDTVYQSDWVIENAYSFICDLINEADCWYKHPEDEVSEEWLEQLEWEAHQSETAGDNY